MRRLVTPLAMVLAIASLALPARAVAWSWPLDGPILRGFSLGADPYAAGQHRGIDIGGADGDPVRAPVTGAVTYAGTLPSSGRTIAILSEDGYSVTLTHLGAVTVARGQRVAEGEVVGTVGTSGVPAHSRPYVQLGVRVAAQPEGYLDPLGFLPSPSAGPQTEPSAAPAPEPAPAPAEAPVAPATPANEAPASGHVASEPVTGASAGGAATDPAPPGGETVPAADPAPGPTAAPPANPGAAPVSATPASDSPAEVETPRTTGHDATIEGPPAAGPAPVGGLSASAATSETIVRPDQTGGSPASTLDGDDDVSASGPQPSAGSERRAHPLGEDRLSLRGSEITRARPVGVASPWSDAIALGPPAHDRPPFAAPAVARERTTPSEAGDGELVPYREARDPAPRRETPALVFARPVATPVAEAQFGEVSGVQQRRARLAAALAVLLLAVGVTVVARATRRPEGVTPSFISP